MRELPEIIRPKIFLVLGLIDIVTGLIIFFKLSTIGLAFDSSLVFIGSVVFTLLMFIINLKIGLVAATLMIILNMINIPFAKFISMVIFFKGVGTIFHYLKICGYHQSKNKYYLLQK